MKPETKQADRSLTGRAARLEAQMEHAERKRDDWAAKAHALRVKLDALRREAQALAQQITP